MAGEIYTIIKSDESKVKMGKSCVMRKHRTKKIVIYRWIKEYGL